MELFLFFGVKLQYFGPYKAVKWYLCQIVGHGGCNNRGEFLIRHERVIYAQKNFNALN